MYVREDCSCGTKRLLSPAKTRACLVYLSTSYGLNTKRTREGRGTVTSLREVRLGRTLSQRDLAEKAGVAPKTIVDLELGRNEPRLRTMRLIAQALGVEVTEIDEFRQALEEKSRRPGSN
jgi:DNA-binding XRE family transcriptional regulator